MARPTVEGWPRLHVRMLGRCDRRAVSVRFSQPWPAEVALAWTRSGSGMRVWFLCPACNRRRAALYRVGGRLACRPCHGFTYLSTRQDASDRALERLYRLHRKMGGSGSVLEAPRRPEGMSQQRYERLRRAWAEERRALWGGLLAPVQRP